MLPWAAQFSRTNCRKKLPQEFLQQFPQGTSVAYSIIPIIHKLEEPFRSQVRVAFAESLRAYWLVLMSVGASGLVAAFFMKALPLHTAMDRNWGLEETGNDTEKEAAEVVELSMSSDES